MLSLNVPGEYLPVSSTRTLVCEPASGTGFFLIFPGERNPPATHGLVWEQSARVAVSRRTSARMLLSTLARTHSCAHVQAGARPAPPRPSSWHALPDSCVPRKRPSELTRYLPASESCCLTQTGSPQPRDTLPADPEVQAGTIQRLPLLQPCWEVSECPRDIC